MVATDAHRDVRLLELTADRVRRTADPAALGFETTESLPAPDVTIGQERAREAIEFALAMDDQNYNLYAAGAPGSGRSTSVRKAVASIATSRPSGDDWCYLFNFEHAGEPTSLSLPAGSAPDFARGVDAFVIDCRRELRRAFAGDAYRGERDAMLKDITVQRQQQLEALQSEAFARGFLLQFTPAGLAIIPLRRVVPGPASTEGATASATRTDSVEYQPMTPVEFEALPPDERERLSAEHDLVEDAVDHALPQLRALEDDARSRLQQLDERIARQAVTPLADSLSARYSDNERAALYLRQMASDIVAHADVLRAIPDASSDGERPKSPEPESSDSNADPSDVASALPDFDGDLRDRPAIAILLRRYRVNILVAHAAHATAPVVQEINPTYTNLMGRMEFGLREGLPFTDHLMLKPGAFHRANGGYLILQARDLLSQPNSYQALKHVLRFGVISMEGFGDAGVVPASTSLRPEPIPVRTKVILIGDPETYEVLQTLDSEFSELFKVRADFDSSTPRSPEVERFYAQFAGDVARRAKAPPLSADAVALLIEEGGRWVSDQGRLSTNLGAISDLTLEAGSFAASAHAAICERSHFARAIAAREQRMSLVPDRLDDMMREGTIMIDTVGEVVGQVNGLTVMSASGYAFGKPARITARTSPGLVGIVNIERETMMSGPAHSKGILVLGGYLAGRFAPDYPLSLAATICFEQIYGQIEGDSASSAELYALLSSLANLPIKQSMAVTGSVNQRGEIQAIGGVNEKIEGFFKLCASRGLTGEQGVIIPQANTRHLMLRREVIEAICAATFHIYAIRSIDEGIEVLTGVPSGVANPDGIFPEGTVNGRVASALHSFNLSVRQYGPHSATLVRPASGN